MSAGLQRRALKRAPLDLRECLWKLYCGELTPRKCALANKLQAFRELDFQKLATATESPTVNGLECTWKCDLLNGTVLEDTEVSLLYFWWFSQFSA